MLFLESNTLRSLLCVHWHEKGFFLKKKSCKDLPKYQKDKRQSCKNLLGNSGSHLSPFHILLQMISHIFKHNCFSYRSWFHISCASDPYFHLSLRVASRMSQYTQNSTSKMFPSYWISYLIHCYCYYFRLP